MSAIPDGFETVDGSRPEVTPLGAGVAARHPLFAFGVLEHGDTFEGASGAPRQGDPQRAAAYARERLAFRSHGAPDGLVAKVRADVARLLGANRALVERLEATKPIVVDLLPPGDRMSRHGFPRSVSRSAAGLFWDKPEWAEARVALRQERLGEIPALVFHEMAHAVQHLAFDPDEQALIYRRFLRAFRSEPGVDEAFAIYTEREFIEGFTGKDYRAPGVYGAARRLWSEDQVLTRFVRALFLPDREPSARASRPPVAGLFG